MPLQKLQLRPGINRESTTLANKGGWYDCDKVRFRSGLPEKIGGWTALTYSEFLGVCRSLWNWVTLKGFNILGLGTNLKFYVEDGGNYFDITPIRETTAAGAVTFDATDGSSTITVTDIDHGGVTSDFVTFSGVATSAGLGGNITRAILQQEYQITVIDANTYTFQARVVSPISSPGAAVLANSSDTGDGGANVVAAYQVNTGAAIYTLGTGWGSGPWPPYRAITLTNPFITVSGSSTITVNYGATNHNVNAGDFVYFTSVANDVAGIPKAVFVNAFKVITKLSNTEYTISMVIGSGSPTYPVITYTANANFPAGTGGSVSVRYPSASLPGSANRGWGDPYSAGVAEQLRIWSQSNYGEQLLFSPRGGALYKWDPGPATTPAYGTRGTLISGVDVPAQINQILVSDATRITICFGCNDLGAYNTTTIDPMLIRWSDQEDYNVWSPTALNQAGSYRLSIGSTIVGALQTRQEILVWTDAAVYSMQYLGPPSVYGFTLLADNISIAGPKAMATSSGTTFWMGVDKFYYYSGKVEVLPCTLWKYVFSDINYDQSYQFFAGVNQGYNEIWWFYCSSNSTTIDKYVVFNYVDQAWYYGTLGRTAWLDLGIRRYPMAATNGNLIVYHEAAVDNGETDPPSPINAYIQSSDFDIGEGNNYAFISRMIPDVTFNGSSTAASATPQVTFTMRPRENPGANYSSAPNMQIVSSQSYNNTQTYNVQQFTEIVYTRVRGREMALRIESNTIGTQWQLGVPAFDIRADGRR